MIGLCKLLVLTLACWVGYVEKIEKLPCLQIIKAACFALGREKIYHVRTNLYTATDWPKNILPGKFAHPAMLKSCVSRPSNACFLLYVIVPFYFSYNSYSSLLIKIIQTSTIIIRYSISLT